MRYYQFVMMEKFRPFLLNRKTMFFFKKIILYNITKLQHSNTVQRSSQMNAVITWIYPSLVFQSLAINLGCVYQPLSHNVYVNLRKMFRISFSKQIVNGWQRVTYWNRILLDRGRPRQSIAVTGLGCSNGDGACLHWLLKIGSRRSLLLIQAPHVGSACLLFLFLASSATLLCMCHSQGHTRNIFFYH